MSLSSKSVRFGSTPYPTRGTQATAWSGYLQRVSWGNKKKRRRRRRRRKNPLTSVNVAGSVVLLSCVKRAPMHVGHFSTCLYVLHPMRVIAPNIVLFIAPMCVTALHVCYCTKCCVVYCTPCVILLHSTCVASLSRSEPFRQAGPRPGWCTERASQAAADLQQPGQS